MGDSDLDDISDWCDWCGMSWMPLVDGDRCPNCKDIAGVDLIENARRLAAMKQPKRKRKARPRTRAERMAKRIKK